MDLRRIRQYALGIWSAKAGELVSLMIHLGDRLGLFRAMSDSADWSSDDLAVRTDLAERPLREWLYGMAAADVLHHHGGRFVLPDEGVAVLVDEGGSAFFAAGAFTDVHPDVVEPVESLMRTGRGRDFDAMGGRAARALERMTAPGHRIGLPAMVLPAMGEVVERLSSGARVADVGCGAAVAGEVVARGFPRSEVVAVDPSRLGIGRARRRIGHLPNLTVEVGRAEDLVDRGSFDLVLLLDVLHDMPRPDLGISAVRDALVEDGRVLVKEPRTSGRFEDDRRNPLLALSYGTSLAGCLQSGLSTEDGWGLGNLGLHPGALEHLARSSGFDGFTRLELPDPAFSYYVITS